VKNFGPHQRQHESTLGLAPHGGYRAVRFREVSSSSTTLAVRPAPLDLAPSLDFWKTSGMLRRTTGSPYSSSVSSSSPSSSSLSNDEAPRL